MKNIFLYFFIFFTFFTYSQNIIQNDNIYFEYKVVNNNLVCILKGKTSGWVAIGFNPTNKMKDANFIIGFVSNNNVVIEDHFGHSPIGHKKDTFYPDKKGKDDITIIGGKEENGWTTLEFSIPLDSKDKYDTKLEIGKTYPVIFGTSQKDNTTSKHKYIFKTEITIK